MIQLSISEQASEVGAFRMSSYSMSTHKQEVCIKIFGVFHWNQLVDNKVFFEGREQCLHSWLGLVVFSRLVT